ncbi:MAG: hypothetical protein PHF31_05805 [Methylobacter sp.]|nr:hypothetical protein [Methylobacter sp.]
MNTTLSVKEVDAILYAWGEWRQKKADLSGYQSSNMLARLMKGDIVDENRTAKGTVPAGVMFERGGKTWLYKLVDGYAETLPINHRSALLAYYSTLPKGRYNEQDRAAALGCSECTARTLRAEARNWTRVFLQSRLP